MTPRARSTRGGGSGRRRGRGQRGRRMLDRESHRGSSRARRGRGWTRGAVTKFAEQSNGAGSGVSGAHGISLRARSAMPATDIQ
eukprot:2549213-Rhodomonas_salina.7